MGSNNSVVATLFATGLAIIPTAGAVEFWSGGLGLDEREYLLAQSADANLKLEFATPSGDYWSDVRISIRAANGAELVNTQTDGPLFFARLPPGRYTLLAVTDTGRHQQHLNIAARGRTALVLRFPDRAHDRVPE